MTGYSDVIQGRILQTIHQIPQFETFGVAYIGGSMCKTIREPLMPRGYQTWIILEEKVFKVSAYVPPTPKRQSNLVNELVDVGLNCGATVLAGTATAASAGSAPLTAGTSLVIASIGYAATVASAAQCGISVRRVFNEIFAPNNNDILDSNEWVQRATKTLDVISLAGGVASLGQAAKSAIRLSRTSGRSLRQVIKGMYGGERKQLARDLAKYAGKADTNRQFVRMVRAGAIPKIFTRNEVSKAIIGQFLDSLSAVLSISGSAKGGVINVYFTE